MRSLPSCLFLFLFVMACHLTFAQSTTSAELNITLGEQRVTFSPTRSFQEMRLEVLNDVGELVFTHSSTDAVFDWNLRAGNGEVLSPGLYRYTLTLTFSEELTRPHSGHFIVEKSRDQIWLTTHAGADISGSPFIAARTGGRSIAGTATPDAPARHRSVAGRAFVDAYDTPLETTPNLRTKLEQATLLGSLNRLAKFGASGNADTDSSIRESAAGHLGFGLDAGTTTPLLFNGDINAALGTSLPALILQSNLDHARLEMRSAGTAGAHAPIVQGRAASGNLSAPGATPANQIMGGFGGSGFDTTNGFATLSSGFIGIRAEEAWTPTAHGTFIDFNTTASGGTTRTEKMRITGAGNVGIGTTAPAAALHVNNGIFLVNPDSNREISLGTPNGEAGAAIKNAGNRADLRFDGTDLRLVATTGVLPPASTNGIAIKTNGNVRIGTDFGYPAKLAVVSSDTHGVVGISESNGHAGMQGYNSNGDGVLGTSTSGNGVRGSSISGYAGYFDGKVRVESIPSGAAPFQVCFNATGDLLQCGSSSLRYKQNVQPYRLGLNTVRRLRPISFEWKEGGSADLGLVAEEVARVAPSLTFNNDKGVTEGVRYEKLNLVLINAVQEQQAQIQQLLQANRALQRQVRQTRQRLTRLEKQRQSGQR